MSQGIENESKLSGITGEKEIARKPNYIFIS
jgi:hypothetical protein